MVFPTHILSYETIQKRWREIMDATLRIGGVFVVGFFLLYGHVTTLMIEELFGWSTVVEHESVLPSVAETMRLPDNSFALWNDEIDTETWWSVAVVTDHLHGPTLERYLQNRLAWYKTPFSLLPPGKHVRIHRLWVDAPIVDISYASAEQMEHGAFHDELAQWVVKYPFTADPWQKWNTLIFWHSSVDFWETKSNPYGFIFSHLNELQVGDTIEIVRNGQQHMYRVEETVIKSPTEVNEVVTKFSNDKFLTLMACYPRFSTAQRILVVAKAIDKKTLSQERVAMHDIPLQVN